jgi:hypothetical protein
MHLHFANPVYLYVSYDSKNKQQFIVCRSLAIDLSPIVVKKKLVTSENMLSERDTIEITVPNYPPTHLSVCLSVRPSPKPTYLT